MPNMLGDHRQEDGVSLKDNHNDGDATPIQMRGSSDQMMQIFEDETELTVRVLPDRSVADWFVQVGFSLFFCDFQ